MKRLLHVLSIFPIFIGHSAVADNHLIMSCREPIQTADGGSVKLAVWKDSSNSLYLVARAAQNISKFSLIVQGGFSEASMDRTYAAGIYQVTIHWYEINVTTRFNAGEVTLGYQQTLCHNSNDG
jgi:hypothetical protein